MWGMTNLKGRGIMLSDANVLAKNGLDGAGITVVYLAAFHTSEIAYSQVCQPARAAARSTRTTGYGEIRCVNFLE